MDLIKMFGSSKAIEELAAGTTIFERGEDGGLMYVILEGEVEILIADTTVEITPAGGLIGEMALIDDKPRSATARTRSACRLARVDRDRFLAMVREEPAFAIHVMQVLGDRLRRMDATMMALQGGV